MRRGRLASAGSGGDAVAAAARTVQSTRGSSSSLYARRGKRLLDLAIAVPLLVMSSPLLAIVALAVRLWVGAPVLFRQRRAGRYGRPFTLIKFCTMANATDEDGRPLPDEERLTRFGRLLRSTSLDELPELVNVLRGDMSLVGPRPLLERYMGRYTEAQKRRHNAPPGLTGWAQINGRNALGWERRFALDLWYVDHQLLRLDLYILGLTAWHVARRVHVSEAGQATMTEFWGSASQARAEGEA